MAHSITTGDRRGRQREPVSADTARAGADGGHRRAAAPAAPTSTAPSTNDNTPGIHIGVGLTDTPSLYVDGVRCRQPMTRSPARR